MKHKHKLKLKHKQRLKLKPKPKHKLRHKHKLKAVRELMRWVISGCPARSIQITINKCSATIRTNCSNIQTRFN